MAVLVLAWTRAPPQECAICLETLPADPLPLSRNYPRSTSGAANILAAYPGRLEVRNWQTLKFFPAEMDPLWYIHESNFFSALALTRVIEGVVDGDGKNSHRIGCKDPRPIRVAGADPNKAGDSGIWTARKVEECRASVAGTSVLVGWRGKLRSAALV